MTTEPETTFVYFGDIDDRYPRDEQLADCIKEVKELDLPSIGRSIYEHNELEKLINNLRRDGLLLLPKLEMLAEYKGRGVGKRFLMNLINVTSNTFIVRDVHAELTSHDGRKWMDHIEKTRKSLTNGRKVSSEQAKLKNKLRHSKPGLVKHWKEHIKVREPDRFTRMAQHWRDPAFNSAEDAIAESPDDELENASVRTWERIFGGRTGGRKKTPAKEHQI